MKKTPFLFVSTLLMTAFNASAQQTESESRVGFNARNNWETASYSVDLGTASGYQTTGQRTGYPVFRFNAENLSAGGVGNTEGLASISVGYAPSGFLRLSYTVSSPRDSRSTGGQTYFILPLIGDLKLRPGQTLANAPIGESLSSAVSYGGIGYRDAGRVGERSSWRAAAAIKYMQISEMFPEGAYSSAGAAAAGRKVVNDITTNGFAVESQGQLSILNRVLLGAGGELASLHADSDGGGANVTYYNAEGQAYARLRVKSGNRFTLDLDANYYVRLTNMTNYRTNKTFQIPGISARIGF